jgi:hypothetical protein
MAELHLHEDKEEPLHDEMIKMEDEDENKENMGDNTPRKKPRRKGKAVQSRWAEEDFRDALAYFASHTTPPTLASGCRVWDEKKYKTANFRGVMYPLTAIQLLAFAAHHPGVRLEQGMSAEAKCGNKLCVTRECLELTIKKRPGPKSAEAIALSHAGKALLQSQRGAAGDMFTRSITVAELLRLSEEGNYAAIHDWMQSSSSD